MRVTKLSLMAVLLLGSSAFAIENTKVSGDAKLYYGTMDSDSGTYLGNKTSFFDSEGSYGDLAVDLKLTTDLTKGVSAGAKGTFVTTLGLENNLVENTWSNSHGITKNTGSSFGNPPTTGLQLDDAFYLGELWIAGSAFDTTLKVGRQALDTPLAFTETWGIDQNTFEAAVVINQSIPDTTLVGAYVGKSNGSADDLATLALDGSNNYVSGSLNNLIVLGSSGAQAGVVSQNGTFNTFGTNGVYVAGLVNNTIKPLTVQAWYYSLQQLADAYWLQADVNVEGILAGAQYTSIDVNGAADKDEAYAAMLGYAAKDVATVKVAYSSVDEQGAIGVGNVATTTKQSKLYTEMWWAYGVVSATGADTVSLTAETTAAGIGLLAGVYMTDTKTATVDTEVMEIALVASKSFGPLDTSLAVIMDDFEDKATPTDDEKTTHLQVYLTYNF